MNCYSQILSYIVTHKPIFGCIAEYYQILLNITTYCWILPNCIGFGWTWIWFVFYIDFYCQILSNNVTHEPIFGNIAQYYQILSENYQLLLTISDYYRNYMDTNLNFHVRYCDTYCPILPNIIEYYQILLKITKYYRGYKDMMLGFILYEFSLSG